MKKNQKTKVYDLPTRIFHWLFALLFLGAYVIAETVGDESALFTYHMLAGLTILFLLVLRFIWGFTGTTYALFSSFKLHPAELYQYLKQAVVTDLLAQEIQDKTAKLFADVMEAEKRKYENIETGRNWVDSYVKYIVYIHSLHQTIQAGPSHGIDNN